jgi:hypothetical protein
MDHRIALALLLAAIAADGAAETLDLTLEPGSGWELSTFHGKADLSYVRDGEIKAVELRSDNASFGLQRKVPIDPENYPIVSWKWKAELLPERGDFRFGDRNDQAIQLYVAFSATRAIGYIWDTNAPEGSEGDLAHELPLMKVKNIVLRSGSGELGSWVEERRDLRADYERLFGESLPKEKEIGLRIWINTQHTKARAASALGELRLEAP